ncbi:MAG: glycosyltransferase family 2 protein [Balneolaceae bacterium]
MLALEWKNRQRLKPELISIITVNYFSEDEILECYSSIIKNTEIDFELILVSNSPIREDFRNSISDLKLPVVIHETGTNLGFAKACNIGATFATGEFLFFLNPDTRFRNDVLQKLFACYRSIDNPGILGPQTFDSNQNPVPSAKSELTAGYFLTVMFPFIHFFSGDNGFKVHFMPGQTSSVPVVNGHALFISRLLFNTIEGWDENFYMYWEENDICIKARKTGNEVIFCKEAELIHKSGVSTSKVFLKMEIEKHRSQRKFVQKNHPNFNLLNRFSGCIGFFIRTLASLFTFNRKEIQRFWTLFLWYTFRYN